MQAQLHCNACFLEFKQGDRAVSTTCHHIFCFDCAKNILTTDSACRVCSSVVTKSTLKAINVLLPTEHPTLESVLSGQHPASALNAALSSIEQYVHQQSLYTEKKIHHLEQKNARMTESCRQKLGELHTAYASAKRKYEEVRTQKQMLEADNRELQDKYAQKAMEAKKLRENVQLLISTKEELQRTCDQLAKRSGVSSAAAALGTNNNQLYGGGGGGGLDAGLRRNNNNGPQGGGQFRGGPPGGGMNNVGNGNNMFSSGHRNHHLLQDPSPIRSPAFNPSNGMKFDFHTPPGLPQQPRGPAQFSSGPIGGSGGFQQHPPAGHVRSSSRGSGGGHLGSGRHTPPYHMNGSGVGVRHHSGGGGRRQGGGGGHGDNHHQRPLSGLGLSSMSGGFDI